MAIKLDYNKMPYTSRGIECLRLGARRGGEGIGCCAVDIIQGFDNQPEDPCPQKPFFDADSWFPYSYQNQQEQLCVGGDKITNEDAFLAYLTHGSFTPYPEADHGFLAVLTGDQCNSANGKKWLAILKREGFQWLGCTSNSVYSEYHPNHVFGLFRSTHDNMEDEEIESLKSPPKAWEQLPDPTETPEERFRSLCAEYEKAHTPATEATQKVVEASRC